MGRFKKDYIHWWRTDEARRINLSQDDMVAKLREVMLSRKEAETHTRRRDYDNEDTYSAYSNGKFSELYLKEDGEYRVYFCNDRDNKKNLRKKEKQLACDVFQAKFKELNEVGLQKAFGYVDKDFKRCIPKQFVYVNERLLNKKLIMSSIDASSQYPSGCLGILPDAHTSIGFHGTVKPTAEYPFAFYKSGHVAIYGELDTHEWLDTELWPYLFRINADEEWPFMPLSEEDERTVLMKASPYSMDSTWRYFYGVKQGYPKGSEEYDEAKLVMNKTIGYWHRSDIKTHAKKFVYENSGYQLAHIVAVAIARGNQKILNKMDEIGIDFVAQVCVDGVLYIGSERFGATEADLGVFCQEFAGVPTLLVSANCYLAKNEGFYKFKHQGFNLIDGESIESDKVYDFADLKKLGKKTTPGDIINGKTVR